jgi:Tfp pilus assembly protein PilN
MTQQINLYNPQFEHKKQVLTAPALAAALGVVAVAIAGLGVLGQVRVARLQAEATRGAQQLAQAQKRLEQAGTEFAPRTTDEQAALQRVADSIRRGDLGDTHGYADTFRALAHQNVEGVWLTGVSVAGAGSDIGIRGRTLDAALVPGYLARLRNEPALQGKAVGSMQIAQAAPVKVRGADGKDGEAPAPYVEFSLQPASATAANSNATGAGGRP